MAGKLSTDVNTSKIQALAPVRVEAISAGGTFTPTSNNRAFSVDAETTVQLNGAGATFTMPIGMSIGIVKNFTYVLGSDCNLLIM